MLSIKFLHNKSLYLSANNVCDLKWQLYHKYHIWTNIYHQGKLLKDHETFIENANLDATLSLNGGIPIAETIAGPMAVVGNVMTAIRDVFNSLGKTMKSIFERLQAIKEEIWQRFKLAQKIASFLKFMAFLQRMLPILYLILIILAFFGKPMEYIMLFIAMVTVCIIYVIYAIITLPPFILVPMLIWFIFHDIVPLIAYCIVFGALLVVILIVCLIVSALNTLSGDKLVNIVLCQNSPLSWYKTPNFHYTNKYERAMLCFTPCKPRYKPDITGQGCVKLPGASPAYCPQAEIMRIYTGIRKDRTYDYKDYNINGNVRYLTKTPLQREEILKRHYLDKIDFMNVCDNTMGDHNNISLAICSAVEMIQNDKENPMTKNMNADDINKLKKVCIQAYCNSKNNYPFCSQISSRTIDDDSDIVKKVIKLAIFIIIFMLIVIFSLNYLL